MKHLIAFLGYGQSRILHPVYRQFVQAPIARRNASLLFQARPLEERELVHEVNELRKRENGPCEVMFHICASLDCLAMGQQIVQTVTMIRRLYDCPSYVYALLPNLDNCTEEQRKTTWKCLVMLNNLVTDYPTVQLMSHCFLYHDASQVSLANFLFDVTQQPESLEELDRTGFIGKLVNRQRSGDVSYIPEFPSVFSTFNAVGVSYPEEEIRYYLQQIYLTTLLSLSRPASNHINMEQCNVHVQELLDRLPLSEDQLLLCDESFVSLPDEATRLWQHVDSYWKAAQEKAILDLDDMPRESWLQQLRNTLSLQYNNRYRDIGVEFYYARERNRTSLYCSVILSAWADGLKFIMLHNPYPPETGLDIIRSLVNHLQQQTLNFTNHLTDGKLKLHQLEISLKQQQHQWDDLGLFDRMRGRDKVMLEQFETDILVYFVLRTRLLGADFAIKLLNELIPQVSALADRFVPLGTLCQGAIDSIARYLNDNDPESLTKDFPVQPVLEAANAIRAGRDSMIDEYMQLVSLLYGQSCPLDSESLLQQLREELHVTIDHYIFQRVEEGTIPPVLDEPLTGRLADLWTGRGGIRAFIDSLKKQTALSLKVKGEGRRNEQYLLIAPDGEDVGPHIMSVDASRMQLIHIQTGISLSDLEGFSGQRMFVEPSIF